MNLTLQQRIQSLAHEVLGPPHPSPVSQPSSNSSASRLEAIQQRLQAVLQKHSTSSLEQHGASMRDLLVGQTRSVEQLMSANVGLVPASNRALVTGGDSKSEALEPSMLDAPTLLQRITQLYKQSYAEAIVVCRGVIDGKTQHHLSVHLHSLFLCPRRRESGAVEPCVLQLVPELVNVRHADLKAVLPLSELDIDGAAQPMVDLQPSSSSLRDNCERQFPQPQPHSFRIGDEVQTMLLSVEDPHARIVLSMRAQRVKGLPCKLGLCKLIERDVRYEPQEQLQQDSEMYAGVREFLKERFNDAVRMDPSFYNPATVDDLITCFGVHAHGSLFPLLRQFEPADFYMAMRNQQNKLYAHENVILGLDIIRKGQDFERALEYLNRALEFDADNSDAMVGRGVIFFNRKEYKKALVEFEMAMRGDAENKNAKLYYEQTRAKLDEIVKEQTKNKLQMVEQILVMKGDDRKKHRHHHRDSSRKKRRKKRRRGSYSSPSGGSSSNSSSSSSSNSSGSDNERDHSREEKKKKRKKRKRSRSRSRTATSESPTSKH